MLRFLQDMRSAIDVVALRKFCDAFALCMCAWDNYRSTSVRHSANQVSCKFWASQSFWPSRASPSFWNVIQPWSFSISCFWTSQQPTVTTTLACQPPSTRGMLARSNQQGFFASTNLASPGNQDGFLQDDINAICMVAHCRNAAQRWAAHNRAEDNHKRCWLANCPFSRHQK